MKKLRNSPFYKTILVLIITACAFSAMFCATASVLLVGGGYVGGDAALETSRDTQRLLYQYQYMTEEYLQLTLATDTSDYTYYQQQKYNERLEELERQLDADNTNFRYTLRDQDGAVLQSNTPPRSLAWEVLGYNVGMLAENDLSFSYGHFVSSDVDRTDLAIPMDTAPLTLEFGLHPELPVMDQFWLARKQFDSNQAAFPMLVIGAVASLLALLGSLVLLLRAAGHAKQSEGISTGWFDRLWLEPLTGAYIIAWCCGCILAHNFVFYGVRDMYPGESFEAHLVMLLWGSGCVALLALLLIPLFYTIAVRRKSRTLLRSTLCYALWRELVWLCRKLGEVFHALRLSWRLALGFVVYEFVSLLLSMMLWHSMAFFLVLLILNLFLLAAMCLWAEAFYKVKQGSKALADGDLSYRVDTTRLPPDLRGHAEHLNNISQGMAAAVEQQMRSERFKAELITNVSHDLKTPLTSIINYVDLLKKEEIGNPTAEEYIQVLDRKSQRLKKLTEDLVEASKASTGTLSVTKERVGVGQLVTQALGEYEERLAARQLTTLTSLPEEEVYVNADGRHLWRILDNLLSNCCKYALPGTRVYVDVVRREGNVLLSVKNISQEPLNLSADQLMERFVRGDESRTTEGSGLGLSIARSLAELQGGQFGLAIDGDLFKATLTLPEVQ